MTNHIFFFINNKFLYSLFFIFAIGNCLWVGATHAQNHKNLLFISDGHDEVKLIVKKNTSRLNKKDL